MNQNQNRDPLYKRSLKALAAASALAVAASSAVATEVGANTNKVAVSA